MPNVNVTYEEMRAAGKQLQAGKADIESRLSLDAPPKCAGECAS